MLIKIISTLHKLLFFKTTDLHTLDTKIWKNNSSSYKSQKNIWINRKLKYYQNRIRSEIGILLEIILNTFEHSTVSLSSEILILAIAPLSFISVGILCELAMLPNVYILLSHQEEEVQSSSWGNRYTHLEAHSSKTLNPLPVIMLVCPGNT